MKIKRRELSGLLELLSSLSSIKNAKVFSYSVLVNKRRVVKRLQDVDVYREKTFNSLVKAAKKKDKKFDVKPAQDKLQDFNNRFLSELHEKYSVIKNEKGELVPNIVLGERQIPKEKIEDYNKDADAEYNSIIKFLKENNPLALELFELQEERMVKYIDKEVTIEMILVDAKDLPDSFSSEDMERVSFLINIPEEGQDV